MNTTEPHLKLRLAARTLIEWKTPITSSEYQRVLANLLNVHPNASLWGFTPNKKFIELDDQGTVLWYLSETMCAEQAKLSVEQSNGKFRGYIEFLRKVSIEGLINYGVSGYTNSVMWTGGPTKSKVADTIIEALTNRDDLAKSISLEVLIILLIPLEKNLQVDKIRELIEYVKTNKYKSLQILKSNINLLTSVSTTFLSILFVVSNLIIISRQYNGIRIIFDSTLSITILRILVFIVSVSLSYYIFSKRSYFERFFKNAVISNSDEAKHLKEKIDVAIKQGELIFNCLGKICSNNPKILVSILRIYDQQTWSEIALAATKNAIPEVIKEVLNLLRYPDVNYSMREQIFQWLCKVKMI